MRCGSFLVGKESSQSSRFEYSCARNASLCARVVNLLHAARDLLDGLPQLPQHPNLLL
jgi:hypothetical protein